MESNKKYKRSLRDLYNSNNSTNNITNITPQTDIEKIDNEIETIENSIQYLHQRLKEAKKVKYELEPTITITDEYSGRTFTFKKNPYELSLQYPKVHPKTGQRLYGKTEHWNKHNGKYIVTTCMYEDFPDTEYSENRWDGYYKLYDDSVGWSRPGYYWHDNSSDYDYHSRYIECPIPDANANAKKNGKKK